MSTVTTGPLGKRPVLDNKLLFCNIWSLNEVYNTNVALFKALGGGELKTRTNHPVNPELPLFCGFD